MSNTINPSRYFMDVVANAEMGRKVSERVINVVSNICCFDSKTQKSLVARMADFTTLRTINGRLKQAGILENIRCKIRYLGGLIILLSFGCLEHAATFLDSKEDGNRAFGSLGVLVGDCKWILEVIRLHKDSRIFRVWVSEESGEWLPKFLSSESNETKVNVNEHAVNDGVSSPASLLEGFPAEKEITIINEVSVFREINDCDREVDLENSQFPKNVEEDSIVKELL
ncbi:hypothetical protein Hanom_Chr16g01483041 [Helianthus anomalus]